MAFLALIGAACSTSARPTSGIPSGGKGGLRLVATGPLSAVAGTPVSISVTGAPTGGTVNIDARATLFGRTWTSSATYTASPAGTVDLATSLPVSGSYAGAHEMGLFWSMQPATPAPSIADPTAPEVVEVTATAGSRTTALHVERQLVAPGVTHRSLRPSPDGFYGEYFAPPPRATIRRPAVLIFGGSEGALGPPLPVGEVLASEGYPTLVLAYFGEPGLPESLSRIPLEYFAAAARWLAGQPGVDARRLITYGVSRGSEVALLLAAYYPSLIDGAVALVPSSTALCDLPACAGAAWTYQGRPVPFTSQTGATAPTDDPDAAIPVERVRGPIFLLCATDDQIWPSCPYSAAIEARLARFQRPGPELFTAPDAGHGVAFLLPYLPQLDEGNLIGATPAANPVGRAQAWPKLLAFLAGTRA